MKSRVRESRTHGSVRGWHREVPVYSTADEFLELPSFFKFFKPYTMNCYVFSLVFVLVGSLQRQISVVY